MTTLTRCPRGHELIESNLRTRPGERSGRECLTCYRDAAVARQRTKWAAADQAAANQIRSLRARAKKMGLTVAKRGDSYTVSDGAEVFVGTLNGVEAWVGARFVGKAPGPARYVIPERWQPWIALLVTDMRAARRSPDTIRLRVERLAAFARTCPDSDPLTVTRTDLVNYMAKNHSWTAEYAHSVRTSLRVFFGLLEDLELRPHDPARRLPRIRIPRGLPRPCPDGAIRAALEDIISDERVRLAIRLGAEAGLRRMEIASLRRDDVEGWSGDFHVHIRRGKGGHARVVPITDEFAHALRASGDGESVYLFPASTGGPITPAHLGKIVADALPEEWTAHTLRHRYATAAYQASGDLRAVQELLGHQSPATTAVYTKVADESIRRAAMAASLSTERRVDAIDRLNPFG